MTSLGENTNKRIKYTFQHLSNYGKLRWLSEERLRDKKPTKKAQPKPSNIKQRKDDSGDLETKQFLFGNVKISTTATKETKYDIQKVNIVF